MKTAELSALLSELHTQLAHPDQLTEEQRSLLLHIRGDMDVLLGRPSAISPTDETAQARLEQAVAEFESSHPSLAVAMQKVLDTLSQTGI